MDTKLKAAEEKLKLQRDALRKDKQPSAVAPAAPADNRALGGPKLEQRPNGKAAWVPRALKKRAAEFAVESDAPAAAPTVAASSGASSASGTLPEWRGKDDLDDLADDDDDEPEAKRVRVKEEPVVSAVPSDAADVKPVVQAAPRDEILDGAPRLAVHIGSVSKFNKVAAMAHALLESGRVTKDNSHAFFTVLQAGMTDGTRLRLKELRVAYRRLYSTAVDRAALFPPAARPTLELWGVQVLVQLDLYTDDTFQFSRAVRQIRERLEQLPCVYPALEPAGAKHMPVDERGPWVDCLFDCIEAAVLQYKYPWAKTSVDILVRAAVDRRQNFSELQQRVVQEWNAMCKGQKIQRQQDAARNTKEQTAYEKKEAEWSGTDIKKTQSSWAKDVKNDSTLAGLDNWMAKQFNN